MALTDDEVRALAQADVKGELKFLTPSEIEQMQLQEQLAKNQPIVNEQPAEPPTGTPPAENPVVQNTVEPPVETPKEPTETPEAILEKITEGKIKNVDELKALLEKSNTPAEDIDPIAKSINEARKKGLDIKAWAAQQLVDVDSYSHSEVALEYLMQTKGWSKDKATTYLENKYFTNEHYEDLADAPREYKVMQIELEDLANEARQYFNSQKIDLDKFVQTQPNIAEMQQKLTEFYQTEEANKQQRQKLAEYIDSSLQGFNSYSFNYTYTDTNAKEAAAEVGLKLNEEQVKRGAEMLKDPQKLIDALTNGGKNMDVKGLVAKINLLTDEKLLSEMFADTRARSTEDYIKKLKNVGAPSIPTYNPNVNAHDEERKRINEILGTMPVVR